MSTQLNTTQNSQTFNFNGNELTVILNEQNEPLFIAKEVSVILGFRSASDATRGLDEDDKGTHKMRTLGGEQNMVIITESGLYSLILKSRKPEAKVFKKWVTSEVLPSIRKHGAYMTPQTIESLLTNPDLIIQLATTLKEEQQKVKSLSITIEEQKPLVEFAEALHISKDSILVGQLATILKQKGVDIGQNRLYQYLRTNGYVISKRGEQYNLPTQRSLNMGLFEVKTSTVELDDELVRVNRTTKVTSKGQQYFTSKFLKPNTKKEAI